MKRDRSLPDPPPPAYQGYSVAPHTAFEAQLHFRTNWPSCTYLFTSANISYVLFDRVAMGEQPFEDATAVVMDALAQKGVCGGVITNEFKMENLTSTELRVVVLALVKIGGGGGGGGAASLFLGNPFCPIGFTLSTYKRRGVAGGGMIMHLELLCAEKQKVGRTKLWIQVGDVLIYHTLRYAVQELGQDIELAALAERPFLVMFYSKHGLILADREGGCAQLSPEYVRKYDERIVDYVRRVPFTDQDLGEFLLLMKLKEERVLIERQGYYMMLCTQYRDRLAKSLARANDVFDKQNAVQLGEVMVAKYKVVINFARRDVELERYRQKLEQMRK